MNIHIPYLKKQLTKRREQRLYEIKPIGSAIRYKRKEMRMTLEEACEGICSISYLSKLENNQIEAGERFMDQLIERFQLKECIDIDLELYESDKVMMAQNLLSEEHKSSEFLNRYEHRDDYQAYLIQMYDAVTTKNMTLSLIKYNAIRGYVVNLRDDELALFFQLTSILLYRNHKFCEAYDLLHDIPDMHEETYETLNLVTTKLKLMNAFRMHKKSEISTNYQTYIQKLIDRHDYRQVNQIKFAFMAYEASYLCQKLIYKSVKKFRHLSEEEKNYALAKTYFHRGDLQKAYDITKKYYTHNHYFLSLYLMTIDRMQKFDDIKQILSEKESLPICFGSEILMVHLRYKYLSSKDQLLDYLRKFILGFNHISDDYQLLDYLMVDAQQLFAKYQFYKEAVMVTSKLLPRLKTLNQAN
jgi:transcriptional regulator with XRE-family HTH domain